MRVEIVLTGSYIPDLGSIGKLRTAKNVHVVTDVCIQLGIRHRLSRHPCQGVCPGHLFSLPLNNYAEAGARGYVQLGKAGRAKNPELLRQRWRKKPRATHYQIRRN